MRWILPAIAALGCGGAKPAPATRAGEQPEETATPVEIVQPACGAYGLYHLKAVSPPEHRENHPAFAVAAAAADRGDAAYQAGDGKAAGHHFLDCARAFRDVADDHFQRDVASENAGYCYKNAYYSFGSASAFKSEGRALLQTARSEDPRMASVLDPLLADDPDCR